MNTEPKKIWCNWLTVVIIGIALFGVVLVIFPRLTHGLFNWIAFLGDRPKPLGDPEVVGYLSFVYGVLGAVMLGWSAAFYYIVRGPFRAGESWSWYALAVPITVWFVADSAHSMVSGFWPNAVFNAGFFMAFSVPLVATFISFRPQPNQALKRTLHSAD